MKKIVWITSILVFTLLGCNRKITNNSINEANNQQKSSSKNNFDESISVQNEKKYAPTYKSKGVPSKIDIDFTKMNFNIYSSILFEISTEPEKYLNKTIKIDGQYDTVEYEGIRYYAVINWDLTGCCPTGLNFIPPDTMQYPLDFPMEGSNIIVIGRIEKAFNGVSEEFYFMADKILVK